MADINEIHKAGEHLLQLIDEVLDLAKIESGHLKIEIKPVSLDKVLDDCYKLIHTLVKKYDIRLLIENNCNEYIVLADEMRLGQSLLNLLSNAIKYNRPRGEVIVRCEQRQDKMFIQVEDTGPGLTKEKQEHLFKPFERLGVENTDIQGTGIGHVITKKIIEMMLGEIGLDSTPGKGSVFWISLHYAEQTNQIEKQKSVKNALTDPFSKEKENKYNVLYVEDNPANLKLFQHTFMKRPWINLHTTHNPQLFL